MRDTKLEMSLERDAQLRKESSNQSELKDKFKAELKNIKANIKKFNKKNNKRNIFNKKRITYLIITMILFNFIIPNKNIIECSPIYITLKIRGPGFSDVLGSSDLFDISYHPNYIYI